MTYSEAEARIAELRQRLENIKSTLGAGDIGMSVDPQTVASAQTQAYHEQFTPQGFVPPQQGTEMFPAASTAVATMPSPSIEEQMGSFIPPGEGFLGNLAKGIPRFAGSQLMFAEQAAKDPVAGLKGLAEFGAGAVEKASYLGVPSKFQHIAAGEREKQLTEEFLNYPFEYFLQVTAPFFIGMGGAKLVAKAKTIHSLMKKGKSFKEATTIGMKAAGIKSPESAMAKWDAELTRQFEQRPKPKPQEAPDALQRQKAADQKATAKAEEVVPAKPSKPQVKAQTVRQKVARKKKAAEKKDKIYTPTLEESVAMRREFFESRSPDALKKVQEEFGDKTISTKEFKGDILDQIDQAVAKAPGELESNIKTSKTFEIPGDGEFKVINTRESLLDFRKRVKALREKATVPKPWKPPKPKKEFKPKSDFAEKLRAKGVEVHLAPKGKIVELEAGPSFIGKAIKRTAGDILDIGKKILISGEGRGKSKPYKGLVESMRRVNDTHGPVRDAFIERLREGGVWKLRLTPKKSVELGEFLIQGHPPPKGHPLHKTAMGYYKAVREAFQELRKTGVKIMTPAGKLKPIGEVPNYFPRRLQAKIKESLFEEAATLVERAQADLPGAEMKGLARGIDPKTEAGTIATLNRLMRDYTPQHADFRAALEYRISTGLSKTKGKAVYDIFRLSGPDIYRRAALEHGRTLDFPTPMYDTDVVRVMMGYADELGRVVGEVKEWGADRTKIVHQLADIAAESPKEGQTAIQMVKQFMGTAEGLTGATRKLAERYVNLAVARKIGLGTATIPNLFQTGISTVMLGYKPTLRGAGALLTKGGRKTARISASPYGDFIRNYYGTDVSNVSLSRQAARFTTTANMFQSVNRFNKALGALTLRYKLPQLHKWANLPVRKIAGKGKMGEIASRRAYGKSMLKRLGVDPTKPLTEGVIIKASHRFATEAQLMKNIIHEPLWMTNPKVKVFSLFKSFIYKQLKFTKDYVLTEAHRNPMPLVRLIASGIGAGELIVQAKELLRETLTGKERERKAQSLVDRAVFDLAASATFGIATEVFDAFDPYETPGGQKRGTIENVLSKLAFLIQPILIDELYKIASMSKKAAVDVADEGFTPKEAALRQGKSAAYIMGSIPGGIFKGQMSKKVREMSIRKLLRDARKATSKDARKKKESAAKTLQTRWNNLNPKDQIRILR